MIQFSIKRNDYTMNTANPIPLGDVTEEISRIQRVDMLISALNSLPNELLKKHMKFKRVDHPVYISAITNLRVDCMTRCLRNESFIPISLEDQIHICKNELRTQATQKIGYSPRFWIDPQSYQPLDNGNSTFTGEIEIGVYDFETMLCMTGDMVNSKSLYNLKIRYGESFNENIVSTFQPEELTTNLKN